MLNVAIDGYAGSGKSALAIGIAQRLGLKVLDTGAIYRAVGYAFDKTGKGEPDDEKLAEFTKDLEIGVAFEGDVQHVFINGEDMTEFLRLERTSMVASLISQFACVRQKVTELQRSFAANNDCVIEGRDIGTVVLPNAQVKFFIIARVEKRAERRYKELMDKPSCPSFEQIVKDLIIRDERDKTRKIAPLKQADDAIVIDNSDLTEEETLEKCLGLIKEKLQK